MSDWQPISTAPKDKTPILAWFNGSRPEPIIVRYVGGLVWPWASMGALNGEYHENYVTHWQPLPEPPEPPK